jgi:choline kinase
LQADDAPLSKPLVRVAGLSLLERAIRVCWQAGVSEVVVVIGFEHVALVTELARLRARYGLTVTPVLNAQWALGNGASAMAAESYVRGAFFLMMCDHIVEPAFFHRLVAGDDGRACAVVIDRDFDAIFDIEEATKVRLVGPDLTGIGKDLVLHDAVDTGVFLCRPPLFEALRDAASVGLWALSDGVRLLALRREVGWVDGTGLRWFDVDTLDDLQHAEQGLDGSPLPHDRSGHPAPHPLSAGDN